jgi:hypothetical protein
VRTVNLIIAVVGVLAAIQSLRLFVLDRSTIRTTALWTTLWLAIAVFGLFPAWLDALMAVTMMESRPFFISVVGVFILYRLQFRTTQEQEQLQRRFGRLVQEVAVLRYQLERRVLVAPPGPEPTSAASTDAAGPPGVPP